MQNNLEINYNCYVEIRYTSIGRLFMRIFVKEKSSLLTMKYFFALIKKKKNS